MVTFLKVAAVGVSSSPPLQAAKEMVVNKATAVTARDLNLVMLPSKVV